MYDFKLALILFFLQEFCEWHGFWRVETETTISVGVHWRGPHSDWLRLKTLEKINSEYWWLRGKKLTMKELPL